MPLSQPWTLASTSLSRRTSSSSPSTLISVPPYLEYRTSSPSATSSGRRCPLSSSLPSPTARTLPLIGFSFAVSGSTMPEAVVSSSSTALTIRRSPRGLSFMRDLHSDRSISRIGTPRGRVPPASIPRRRQAVDQASGPPAPGAEAGLTTGGMPRSRRMTKGGVRVAPSCARWTRAATWADLRRVRGPRLPPDHPAPQDARRAQGRPQAADLRARHMDVRRGRLSAQGDEAALPDRRVQARLPVGQRRSAAPAGPARVEPLDRPVPEPRRCEREFGRLKNEWALPPLRVHGLDRVRLHADLTILAKHAWRLAGREPCRSRLSRSLAQVVPPVGIAVVKPLDDARPVAFDLHDVIDGKAVDGEIVNVSTHARNVLAHPLGEAVNEFVQPRA